MITKTTNGYKPIQVSDTVNTVYIIHVSATLVAIVRAVSYKGYVTEGLNQCTKCKILSFTMWFKIYNNM
jgi:hypothetical protein